MWCCKRLNKIMTLLCSFAKKTHQTIKITRIFQEKKNRLRNENLTLWSSSFLMLLCFYKAYEKKCFETVECPVSKAEIEFYLSLMLPAYRFTLLNQRNRVHIGDLVPSLHLLIMHYEEVSKKDVKKKQFCDLLIKNIKKQFEHELNSVVYAAASVLNVSKLYIWYHRPVAKETVNLGLGSLVDLAIDNNKSLENLSKTPTSTSTSSNTQNIAADDEAFDLFYQSFELDHVEQNKKQFNIEQLVEKEKELYVNILRNCEFTNKTSYEDFWYARRKEMPYLYKLSLMYYNIPTSSAYVERFFSICGIVNRKRAGNMSDDTLINRAFLKSNLNILNEMEQ